MVVSLLFGCDRKQSESIKESDFKRFLEGKYFEVSKTVDQLSDFEYQLINGQQENLESNKGNIILLNFWATWCPPCVEELPSIQNARDKFDQSHFEVVAVNVGEKVAEIEAFLEALPVKLTFPIVVDEKLSVYADWQVRPLPATFLVDRTGKIRYQALGGRDFASAKIRAIIQELIDE